MLLKRKGFTLVVVLTLALATGTTTTLFSIVSKVLFTPLAFEAPETIAFVWSRNEGLSRVRAPLTFTEYDDLRRKQQSFADVAALAGTVQTLTGATDPAYVDGYRVSASFFPLMGVEMRLGRTFHANEDRPGAERVAILSHGAWERRFGADPEILGRELRLDGTSYTVIGVVAEAMERGLFESAEVWTPLALDAAKEDSSARNLTVMARLTSSLASADAEVGAFGRRMAVSHPATNAGWDLYVQPLGEILAGPSVRGIFVLLILTVAFVLAIACSNVANMLLAYMSTRQSEIELRRALGASQPRLVGQLLTEALLLSAASAALGLLFAHWTMQALVLLTREQIPLFVQLRIDGRALAFSACLVLVTPILFALAPALRTARARVETRRPRFFLIAGEVAIALTLLILAGLTVRTTAALRNLELGFDANDLLTMRIDLPDSRYSDGVAPRAFFDGLVRQARAVPGAESAALTSHRPIVGSEPNQSLVLEGRLGVLGAAPDDVAWAATTTVSTEFFRTLRIPLLSGRVFTDAETSPTAVISRSAHERYWAGENPIGTRFRFGDDGDSWWTVVGIVEDLRNPDADQPPEPHVYLPFEQQPSRGMALVVRSRTPLALTPELRVIVSELDAAQPIGDIRTMGQILHDDLSGTFAVAGLMSYFTLVAFALAIAGIFGVLSYSVAARSRELGVRLALGAERTDICWMVLREAFAPVGAGIAVGCLVALGLSRFMASFVFGITTTDPATYLFVTLSLAVSATVACGVPALRAARIDPIVTLRHD